MGPVRRGGIKMPDSRDQQRREDEETIGPKAKKNPEAPLGAHFAKEVSMYLVFGGLTTLINLVVYSLLVLMGLHYGVATSAAFILAVLFAYETNKRFVFDGIKATAGEEARQISAFFSSRIATFALETAGLVLLIEVLGMGHQLSKYLMTAVVVVLNYLLSKHLVFRKKA